MGRLFSAHHGNSTSLQEAKGVPQMPGRDDWPGLRHLEFEVRACSSRRERVLIWSQGRPFLAPAIRSMVHTGLTNPERIAFRPRAFFFTLSGLMAGRRVIG